MPVAGSPRIQLWRASLPICCLLLTMTIVGVAQDALWAAQAWQSSRTKPEQTAQPIDPRVTGLLGEVVAKHGIPGIVAAVMVDGKLVACGAAGVRKTKTDVAINVEDKFHLGSCTKAMTATVIGMLVDDGQLNWTDTIADCLPQLRERIDRDYHSVTIWQLLTHRAALAANGPYWLSRGSADHENRLEIAARGLKTKPESLQFGQYAYSNLGYVVAGTMAEAVTGKSWEQLIQGKLFQPLNIRSGGFGAPSRDGRLDQPWGHALTKGNLFANQFDNAPSMGPAGRVHCSIADWSKFIELHLDLTRSHHKLLKPETLRRLHSAPDGNGSTPYAGGWIVRPLDDGTYELAHEGSNNFWMSTVVANPARGTAVLIISNTSPARGVPANHDAIKRLTHLFDLKFDQ